MAQLPIRKPSLPSRPAALVPTRLVAPPQALVELAGLLRERLQTRLRHTIRAGVHGVVRLGRAGAPTDGQTATTHRQPEPQPDAVIVAAAAQFAPNAYARARLLRQMHACGLLTVQETQQVEHMLGVAN